MKVIAEIDDGYQAYLMGYIACSQLSGARPVRFYIDTGSTITTLLGIDIVKLGLKWSTLRLTRCDTAIGPAEPYILPSVTILLKQWKDHEQELIAYNLKSINLLPPDDPTKVFPVEYDFAFSLLGMDVLKNFNVWTWKHSEKQLLLESV